VKVVSSFYAASLAIALMGVSAPWALAQAPGAPNLSSPANNPPPAQGKSPAAAKPAAAGASTTIARMPPPESKPTWQELTAAQQASLKPLAANWSGIGEAQKRKWLALSKNYPSLPAPEQAVMHSRMTEWASLSQQQRTEARLNFAETKKLSPGEKTANWQAYQALSPEDRQKLAATASPKPAGAAAAVKPVAPQKLAAVPLTRQDTKHAAEGASGTPASQTVDRNTLLPRPPSAAEPAVRKN
jgi:Protein of unknown function (DUF3106)